MQDIYKVISDNLEYKDITSFRLVNHFHNNIFFTHWIYNNDIVLEKYNIYYTEFPDWLEECKLILMHCNITELSIQLLPDTDFYCCYLDEIISGHRLTYLTVKHIQNYKLNNTSRFKVYFCSGCNQKLCENISKYTKYHQIYNNEKIKVEDLELNYINYHKSILDMFHDHMVYQDEKILLIVYLIYCYENVDLKYSHGLIDIDKTIDIIEGYQIKCYKLYEQYKEVIDYIQNYIKSI